MQDTKLSLNNLACMAVPLTYRKMCMLLVLKAAANGMQSPRQGYFASLC